MKWPIFKDKLVVCFSGGYLLMLQESGEAPEEASVGASLRWVLTVTPPRRHLVVPTPIKLHGWEVYTSLLPTVREPMMWLKEC